MNRIVGIETEYGCLVTSEDRQGGPDVYPIRVKNHVFKNERLGAIDLHYRDYEEPPGNGGFLINGGRLYLDMGHIEYATPECRTIHDILAYDRAGDLILQNALDKMGLSESVFFVKNNIDHYTGATFGCHENYLMRREAHFTPQMLSALLSFLATRQIFTGAGRVGQANPLAFEFEPANADAVVNYQISQRADHIVNDIYQWVQFNRAIINARDEPLADYRKYRRLHLLIGDSNMSEYTTALKVGTTAIVLDLLEEGIVPKKVGLMDPVQSTRDISRDQNGRWMVRLDNGQVRPAIEIQQSFLNLVKQYCVHNEEDAWIVEQWEYVLNQLASDPMELRDRIDWIAKKHLLQQFIESEKLSWQDPWLHSLDLEYHNLDPRRGLYHGLVQSKAARPILSHEEIERAIRNPPENTRARARGYAVQELMEQDASYIINWDSIALQGIEPLRMDNPFYSYINEVQRLLHSRPTVRQEPPRG
ncbi:MAG: hypothetical protein EXS18_01720 [Verrucomicrobiae bacterium]|nr:hypothetical protein [Verrucomicrobiae bacterium]